MSEMRTQPQDAAAEQSVIAGTVWSAEALDEVGGILAPRDFYQPAHEAIWASVLDMVAAGIPLDWTTLPAHLHRRGDLNRIGGRGYLTTLMGVPSNAANVGYHARIVMEHAVNRRLIESGTRIIQLGYGGGDASANVTAAQGEVLDFDAPTTKTGRWIGPIVDDVMEAAESGTESVPTVDWGYGKEMPAMTCGRMTILAGRPGLGKSTAGLDAARHVAIHLKKPVAFFSLEMSQAEVGARTAAAEAGIMLPNVQKGEMSPEDWDLWARRGGLILDAPLWVDEFPRADPGYIRSVCRRIAREKGPLGLVVVDYLQLMEDNGAPASKSRQQTVSEFSRALTILAKDLGTAPVLALAQLNRGPEQRTDKKPAISDLRESGTLEQDASQVILIHREDAYEKESPRAGEVDLIIGKNRGGPSGFAVTLAAQLHFSRFVPMAGDTEPASSYGAA